MEITEVKTRKDRNKFMQVPFSLYKNDPVWVPPLLSEQRTILNPYKNPFFKHSISKAWVISKNNQPIGRIFGFIDTLKNSLEGASEGFFGFFECIDEQEVVDRLFGICRDWLAQNGIKQMVGPMNLSIGNECGVQLDGFEYPPVVQMNYNPKYYRDLFEKAGFSKVHDLYAYYLVADDAKNNQQLMEKLEKIGRHALENQGIKFRSINLKDFNQELEQVRKLFNESMNKNWGFVPASFEEIEFMGKSLRQIADTDLIFFAETEGKIVGCSVSVPDINQALIHVRNGKLFPTGIFKLLYYSRKIDRIRLFFMGVLEEYRNKGLDAVFYYQTVLKVKERGYKTGECSWVSEDNKNLIKILERFGATRYKTYRMYQKSI
jgi:predicted GNAT family acetyltransferase